MKLSKVFDTTKNEVLSFFKKDVLVRNILLLGICTVADIYLAKLAYSMNTPFRLNAIGYGVITYVVGPFAGMLCATIATVIGSFTYGTMFLLFLPVAYITAGVLHMYMKNNLERNIPYVIIMGTVVGLISAGFTVTIALIFNTGINNAWGQALCDRLVKNGFNPHASFIIGEIAIDVLDRHISVLFIYFLFKIVHYLHRKGEKNKQQKSDFITATIGFSFICITLVAFGLGAGNALLYGHEKTLRYTSKHHGVPDEGEIGTYRTDSDLSDYVETVYGRANGLMSAKVNDMICMPDGKIWIGSDAGLVSFDGVEFKFIDDGTIKNVNKLWADKDGVLWVGTRDMGVAKLGADGKFTFIDTLSVLEHEPVTAFGELDDGTVFVAMTSKVIRIKPQDGENTIATWAESIKDIISFGDSIVYLDENGSILRFEGKSEYTFRKTDYNNNKFTSLVSNGTKIFASTEAGNINVFENSSYGLSFKTNYVPEGIETIDKIACGGQNDVWFISGNTIGRIDENGVITTRKVDESKKLGCLMVDYQGNVWIGANSGIIKLSEGAFHNVYEEYVGTQDAVNTVFEFENRLYIGTQTGLVIIDRKYNKLVKNSLTNILEGSNIRNFIVDSNGCMWICTTGKNGLIKLYPSGKSVMFNRSAEDEKRTLSNDFRCVYSMEDGSVIAGTAGGGAYLIKDDEIAAQTGIVGDFGNVTFNCIGEVDGTIYMGTEGSGIFVFENGENTKIYTLESGLTSDIILQFEEYDSGIFAVTGNSIAYIKGDTVKTITSFPYFNNYDIVTYKDNAYITSSMGLYILSTESLLEDNVEDYILMDELTGCPFVFTENAKNRIDSNNDIMFCTEKGLMIYKTEKNQNYFDKRYHFDFTGVTVGAGSVYPNEEDIYVIGSGEDLVKINFAVYSYGLQRVKYRIFLEDDETISKEGELNEKGTFNLAGLLPGVHKVWLQLFTSDGERAIQEKAISLQKNIEVYETVIFDVFIIFVFSWNLVTIVFAIVQYIWILRKRRNKMESTLKTYVDEHIVDDISKKENTLELNRRVEVDVFFIDIRGFTSFSEKHDPFQVVEFLNSYFKLVTDCIKKNGGTLDKFIGDAVMALYNVPALMHDHAFRAVKTAVDVRDGWKDMLAQHSDWLDYEIEFGIGIHTGVAIVGNIGCEAHMDYTAIGDVVNTASRLESNAKHCQIIISKELNNLVDEEFDTESLGMLKLKGKDYEVEAYVVNGLKDNY